jgi:hypothetical protein
MPVNFVLSFPPRTLVMCVAFMHFKNVFGNFFMAILFEHIDYIFGKVSHVASIPTIATLPKI